MRLDLFPRDSHSLGPLRTNFPLKKTLDHRFDLFRLAFPAILSKLLLLSLSGFTPRGMTPKIGGTPGVGTPSVRDNLSINREDAFYDDLASAKQIQMENKNQLLAGLSSLPKPTNDFEIVVPEVCLLEFH